MPDSLRACTCSILPIIVQAIRLSLPGCQLKFHTTFFVFLTHPDLYCFATFAFSPPTMTHILLACKPACTESKRCSCAEVSGRPTIQLHLLISLVSAVLTTLP